MDSSDSEFDTCDSDEDDKDYITVQYRVVKLPNQKNIMIEKELYDNIQAMPHVLKHRLYIRTMPEYWKDQGISHVSRVPLWYASAVKQQQLLFDATCKNIHFLHLPCNTLPEYKTYIVGCQCDYCLYHAHPIEKKRKQRLNREGFLYFYDTVPYTDSIWNDKIEIINYNSHGSPIYGLPVFNPDYELLDKTPAKFSEYDDY